MKARFYKKRILIGAIVLSMSLGGFSSVSYADSADDVYAEVNQKHSSEIQKLIDNGADEEATKSFIREVHDTLKSKNVTQSNFDEELGNTLIDIYFESVNNGSHSEVFSAASKGWPDVKAGDLITAFGKGTDAVLDVLPSVFKDIGNSVENKILASGQTSTGGGGGAGGGGGGGGPIATKTNTTQAVNEAIQTIKASERFLIELENTVKVDIPAGVVQDGAEVIAKILDENDVPAVESVNLQRIGQVIEVKTNKENKFAQDISLQFQMDQWDQSKGKPAVFYFNELRNKWMYIGGEIDNSNKSILVKVNHFTKFAVFQVKDHADFKDVPTNHWAYNQVDRLVGLGIVNGRGNGEFDTKTSVTRAEFAKMVSLALDLPKGTEAELQTFSDAARIPSWAKEQVSAAVKAGLLEGKKQADGSVQFSANTPITRTEMAVMVSRVIEKKAGNLTQFKDVQKIPAWAKEGVAAVIADGIMTGTPDQNFEPNKSTSRGEAAVVIGRILHQLGL
ncbi:S-layer homology domain-containing protein [Ammoniphilus resinae]|uniref:SLH domain-containing protein n=1 Tax=Ammoniphilus resinae TaxID=861532 RepID=A0ABS4GWW5_9BACL|nr:S-layer homology domain-containing protein [Ammoniphilus resinae]MBP1934754.1 hypothetical protein [Ammoniphilus resinae]